MYRNSGVAIWVPVEPMLELSGEEAEKGVWTQVGLCVRRILCNLVSPQLVERQRPYISDEVLEFKI